MFVRSPHNPSPYDDDWEDQPPQGPFFRWILGVSVPLAMVGLAARALVRREVNFSGRVAITLHGTNAVAFGVAIVAAAVFLHCHYYWGNVYNQAWFAVLGKIISACAFIAGLATVIVRVGVLGVN
jgi:hypothetical protein